MPESTQLRLARRPRGKVALDDFTLVREPLRPLAEGEALVRNFLLSVDPTNRVWMSDAPQYMPPVKIGEVMRAIGLGVVEASRRPDLAVGQVVRGLVGWQDHWIAGRGAMIAPVPNVPDVPLHHWLGILGSTGGLTAYFGLLEIGRPQPGETVVVTAAAGSVGSLAGQIAKIHGCRVIGVAGGPEKQKRVVEEYGFDACIDYKSEDVGQALDRLCPDGVDVLFENVGGTILDAVLARLRLKARVALCGLISQYAAEGPTPGPSNFSMILMRRARVEGFIVSDFTPRYPEATRALLEWLQQGRLTTRYQILEGGLPVAVDAVNRLLEGRNDGKLLLRVAEDPR
ncbi:MAG: NADP-dependent oxidoreductase [Pseudomonadota bacterium]|nr:NADP-dependent oxidoreductase [Pseudomonadota bacterium]